MFKVKIEAESAGFGGVAPPAAFRSGAIRAAVFHRRKVSRRALLHGCRPSGTLAVMLRWLAMTRLLAALAILGLIVGSFAAPTQARIANAVSVSSDMPCCVDKAAPDCVKSCPLAIMCFDTSLPVAATAVAARRVASDAIFFLHGDAPLRGVGCSPPRRPPRL
jgi:hypothetical protein